MKPIIVIKNLNFTYNKAEDNEFQALINVNLDIYPEEFIIIYGPSGCGKSTLVNVIGALEVPDTGSVVVFGKDLITMNKKEYADYHRSQVGMIYQAYNLITSLTVLDNVALPQIFLNVRKGKRDKWSRSLLERFGILKQARKVPTELSGGQQQRIGIARAIVNNPQIVLADEPVGNLDSVSAKNVLEILRELNEKEKKTIIMVTHNPEHLPYGDRIIHMKDGLITGETINRDKHLPASKERDLMPKPPSTEIQDLMRSYHGLSPEQINILIMPYKAKVFSQHFTSSRNLEETRVLEDVIQRRLLGTISLEEFFDIVNRPAHEGGVGFDRRTTDKVMRRVNRIIRMAYFIYQKNHQRKNDLGQHEKVTVEEKTEKLTGYLLKTCYNQYFEHLEDVQINRLKKAVMDRLDGRMQKSEFYNFLDQSFKAGGIGLNSKTARSITEEIELILILGFGIVQRVPLSPLNASQGKQAGDTATNDAPPQTPGSAMADDTATPALENEAAGPAKIKIIPEEDTAENETILKQVAANIVGSLDNIANIKENISEEPEGTKTDFLAESSQSGEINQPEKDNADEKLSDEELRRIIGEVLKEEPDADMMEFAPIMKQVSMRIKDRADDERVIEEVKKALLAKS